MCLTNYIKVLIGSLIILTLTTLVSVNSQAQTTCTTNALGDRTCTTVTSGTTTGNVLTNSTFGTGNTTTTTGWSTDGNHGVHTHGNFGFTYPSGADTSGGVLAFEGDPADNVYQDVDLVGDGHLTKSQINEGFTSTQSADVWFWNNLKNTLTLKQTITAADGTVTTQTKVLVDHVPSRSFNGGSFTQETNSYTHSANTQNDFTIRTELYNDTDGTNYDSLHRGPDVDNVQLSITTAGTTTVVVTPCFVLNTCTTIGDDIDEAVNLETEDGIDLFDDIDTKVEDAIQEFEEVELVAIDTMIVIENDIGEIEEVKFEEFIQESFTEFLETNDLVEDFKTELEVEGISEEEFFEELGNEMMVELGGDDMFAEFSQPNMESDEFYMTDAEMETFIEENPDMIEYADENTIVLKTPNDMEEPTLEEPKMEETSLEEPKMEEMKEEEISDEPVEEVKEESIKEESINEESNKEESNESTEPDTNTNEEIKEESNETNEKPEDSESVSNESEVAEDKETEGSQKEETDGENVENETIESNETETNEIKVSGINEKVQRVLDKVLSKLKRVDQKLKAIQMVTSKGITSGEADLSGYINKRIYTNQVALKGVPNPDFFQNLNILEQQQIYEDANLAAYVSNDPIAVKQKLLQEINVDKQRLLLELRALKNEG
jgi:hypothetical protein